MSKRFTDTEKWERPWFRKLPTAYKLLWQYITDKCDLAGIWYVDFELAGFVIGENLAPDLAQKFFEKQVTILGDGTRWFIKDFPVFQYGNLKPTNNLHLSVMARLESLGLAPGQPQTCPSPGAKEKDKEKEYLKKGVQGEEKRYSEAFEKAWKVFPQKGRVAKGAAWRVWVDKKLDGSAEAIIQAIQGQVESSHFRGKDGQDYVPHFRTWLFQGRWEDEISGSAQRGNLVL